MRRLTTPEHRFTLQMDVSAIEKIRITYAQNGNILLTKENPEVKIVDKVATVKLSQEETKLFHDDKKVEIQVRVLTTGGDALASDIITIDCKKVLDEEII